MPRPTCPVPGVYRAQVGPGRNSRFGAQLICPTTGKSVTSPSNLFRNKTLLRAR